MTGDSAAIALVGVAAAVVMGAVVVWPDRYCRGRILTRPLFGWIRPEFVVPIVRSFAVWPFALLVAKILGNEFYLSTSCAVIGILFVADDVLTGDDTRRRKLLQAARKLVWRLAPRPLDVRAAR